MTGATDKAKERSAWLRAVFKTVEHMFSLRASLGEAESSDGLITVGIIINA